MRDWAAQRGAAVFALLVVVAFAWRWRFQGPRPEPTCQASVAWTPPGEPRRWICPAALAEQWPARCGAAPEVGAGATVTLSADCQRTVGQAEAEARLALGLRLDVNRATWAELQVISGIGPALATRIVAGRPYTSLVDLERVRGIGPRTRQRLARVLRAPSAWRLRGASAPRTPSGSRSASAR